MIWNPTQQRQRPIHPTNNPQRGGAAERLELLRLRDSDDPVARAIALGFSQVLRKLDDIAAGMEVVQ